MRPFRSTTRRARAFARRDRCEQALVLEAVARLAVARALIVSLPLHRLARRLVGRAGIADDPVDTETVARIIRAVRDAARAMPFRAACLEQAFAAAAMLRRHRIRVTLHLGTARDDGFAAHAWLSVAGTVVIGGPVDRYAEIARY